MGDGESLRGAAAGLLPLATGNSAGADPAAVALMMVVSALRRKESRGAHCRTDFPAHGAVARRSRLTLREAVEAAATTTSLPIARSA